MIEANGDGLETVGRAPAVRVGRRRHDAAAGHDRAGPHRAAALDRRRPPAAPRPRTSTTRSRASCSPPSEGRPGNEYFVTDGSPVVFREFVDGAARHPGRAGARGRAAAAGARALAAARRGRVAAAAAEGARRRWTRFALWVTALECTLDDTPRARAFGYAAVIPEARPHRAAGGRERLELAARARAPSRSTRPARARARTGRAASPRARRRRGAAAGAGTLRARARSLDPCRSQRRARRAVTVRATPPQRLGVGLGEARGQTPLTTTPSARGRRCRAARARARASR